MSEEKWIQVGPSADLGEGSMVGIEHGDLQIAVYNVEGEFYATDNICTHSYSLLTEGFQDGPVIECAVHGGTFDIPTGEPGAWPCEKRLRTYAAVLEDGWVAIEGTRTEQDDQ